MLEILIVHPDDAVDTLLLENKEQRGALTLKMSAWVPSESVMCNDDEFVVWMRGD